MVNEQWQHPKHFTDINPRKNMWVQSKAYTDMKDGERHGK